MQSLQIKTKNVNTILSRQNITLSDVMRYSLADAKQEWAEHRTRYGFKANATKLLTPPSANEKLAKSVAYGLALSPALSSGFNTCPMSTASCRAACVAYAGKGAYSSVQRARQAKTTFLVENTLAFLRLLIDELDRATAKHGSSLVVRLNTFSDIDFAGIFPFLIDCYPVVTFYDYTKVWSRAYHNIPNYHLGLSVSERIDDGAILAALRLGANVAMVVNVRKGEPMPTEWNGYKVIDADLSDRWMIGERGVIGALRPKGLMKIDSPMVRKIA